VAAGGAGAAAWDGGGWRAAAASTTNGAAATLARLRATPLCVLTAKPEELAHVVESLRGAHSRQVAIEQDPIIDAHEQKFFFGELEVCTGYKVPFYITSGRKQGVQSFAISASYVFSTYQPQWAVMAGICAGNADKMKAGDVIFSCAAIQYEEGKMDAAGVLHPSTKTEHAAPGVVEDVAELLKSRNNERWKTASMLSGCAVLENAATVFERVTHSVRFGVLRGALFRGWWAHAMVRSL
jgi:nucleoside phosphorylase